ncbi:phage baseplate assembly protein V, partial [Empedobacter falsenii]|uniref:phage baseplate assembly protein V n=1 Tax=Empedobacter falsenii TaxID=343874 RepID=UPI002577E035
MRKQDSNKTSYFTRIMITDVEHDIDTLGHYTGLFKAIASDTGFLPKPEFTTPIAQPQIATVISNADPKGQGRVTVKFDWQLHDTTNFIRMMSPDAGGTDQVTQNRGYVAIPEVGDQVMVGFVHNHPDRPFVMGGMFHGKVGLGGGTNNSVKSIQTRSGHRIIFTEDESIVITDKSGNEIHLDTIGSNINITAPETINIKCKNFNIDVQENMNTSVGINQMNSIGMNFTNSVGVNYIATAGGMMTNNAILDYSLMAANIMEIANGNKTSKSKEVLDQSSDKKIISENKNEIHSQGSFDNNGGEGTKMH